ncbi:MAG: pilus assembly protein [Propionibacteriaceae bacterium]|jgi:Flp pilus assembly protein TadG|nr:pilus assembly protein [Propionibacteriaceae bacterium]
MTRRPGPGRLHSAARPGWRGAAQRPESRQRGSVTLETAILTPILLLAVCLIILGGRIATTSQGVDQAAWDAARAASISRTPGDAEDAVAAALANQDIECFGGPTVLVDTSGFAVGPAGPDVVEIQVEVVCTVSLADLAGLAVPGSITLRSTSHSGLDRYRERS